LITRFSVLRSFPSLLLLFLVTEAPLLETLLLSALELRKGIFVLPRLSSLVSLSLSLPPSSSCTHTHLPSFSIQQSSNPTPFTLVSFCFGKLSPSPSSFLFALHPATKAEQARFVDSPLSHLLAFSDGKPELERRLTFNPPKAHAARPRPTTMEDPQPLTSNVPTSLPPQTECLSNKRTVSSSILELLRFRCGCSAWFVVFVVCLRCSRVSCVLGVFLLGHSEHRTHSLFLPGVKPTPLW
jgi:hypothetical protein